MSNDIETQLAQAQKEYEKTKASILNGARTKLENSLNKALADYEAIPEGERSGMLSDVAFTEILKAFGLTHKGKKAGRSQKAPSKFTDEQVLDYVSDTARTSKEIIAHFGSTSATVGPRMSALMDADKVTMKREGTSKYWKKKG